MRGLLYGVGGGEDCFDLVSSFLFFLFFYYLHLRIKKGEARGLVCFEVLVSYGYGERSVVLFPFFSFSRYN